MKGGPKSSLRPFLHQALQLTRTATDINDQCPWVEPVGYDSLQQKIYN